MRALPSLVLVACALACALGLAAVAAGLTPATETPNDPVGSRRSVIGGGVEPAKARPHNTDDARVPPFSLPTDAPAAPTQASATGPWKSPLYPQNGVTLWDRIRSSSPQDERAYLTGTAIQLHAAQVAATPGPPRRQNRTRAMAYATPNASWRARCRPSCP